MLANLLGIVLVLTLVVDSTLSGEIVKIKLLTKENRENNSILLNVAKSTRQQLTESSYCRLNPRNCTNYMIVHGYRSNAQKSWILNLTKELFKKNENTNVFVIDWSSISSSINYFAVGKEKKFYKVNSRMILLFDDLIKSGYISNETVANGLQLNLHCIGHSLGAHLCGSFGSFLRTRLSMRLKRITGLDPAGPLFENAQPTDRLDLTDAMYVDIIHSSSFFGIDKPIGHVDFYANGGKSQPACNTPKCDHKMAGLYFILSINSAACKYRACECQYSSKNKYKNENCNKCGSKNFLGLYSIQQANRTAIYYLETNEKPAYCKS